MQQSDSTPHPLPQPPGYRRVHLSPSAPAAAAPAPHTPPATSHTARPMRPLQPPFSRDLTSGGRSLCPSGHTGPAGHLQTAAPQPTPTVRRASVLSLAPQAEADAAELPCAELLLASGRSHMMTLSLWMVLGRSDFLPASGGKAVVGWGGGGGDFMLCPRGEVKRGPSVAGARHLPGVLSTRTLHCSVVPVLWVRQCALLLSILHIGFGKQCARPDLLGGTGRASAVFPDGAHWESPAAAAAAASAGVGVGRNKGGVGVPSSCWGLKALGWCCVEQWLRTVDSRCICGPLLPLLVVFFWGGGGAV